MIDAHQHFWRYNSHELGWISEAMANIRRDFLPEDLEPILKKNGISGCVLVQVNQNEAETETFLKLANAHNFIKGVVGWIDLRVNNLEERLTYYQQFELLKGFRHIVQAEKVDFLSQPDFIAGAKVLARFDYTYDMLITPPHLKAALHFVRQLPENKLVIDHLAKPDIKNKKINTWANYMREIAQNQQVFCKSSGLITEADWQNWTKEDIYPYLDIVVETFGTKRLMFGSDWPVCLVAGQYDAVLNLIKDYFSQFSEQEQWQIFGENAQRFYNL